MLWYPKKPEGGIRKASRKHDKEDKERAPKDYGQAAIYWSDLSKLYSRTSDYYMAVSGWWLGFAGIFLAISLLFQVVALICILGS